MRVIGTLTRRSARTRLLAAVLLCLVAHGFFASVTHHHSASPQKASGFSIESGDRDGSGKLPQTGDDSSCVSCRVSRSFNSLERSQYLVAQCPVQAVVRQELLTYFLPTDNLFRTEQAKVTLRLTGINLTNNEALYNFLSTFSGTHFVTPRAYQAQMGITF